MSDLLIERRKAVVVATLNRPQTKNALNAAIVEGLFALCNELANDSSARALVLRGAGRRGAAAFAARRQPDWVESVELIK